MKKNTLVVVPSRSRSWETLVMDEAHHLDTLSTKPTQELGRFFRDIPVGKTGTFLLTATPCGAGKSVQSVQAFGRLLRKR